MQENGKQIPKFATSATRLVFFTDTDTVDEDYPIYLTPSREVWIKKKPNAPILATFVARVSIPSGFDKPKPLKDVNEVLNHVKDDNAAELVKLAYEALKSLSSFAIFYKVFEIKYEAYRGDYLEYLGEATAKAVKMMAVAKFHSIEERQAWGVAYSNVKRISAKFPALADYVYPNIVIARDVTDNEIIKTQRKLKPFAVVTVKVPVATAELLRLFDSVVAEAATTVPPQQAAPEELELENEIKRLEELINQKEAELQALKERLAELRMKYEIYRIEKMKERLVG